MLLLLLSLIAVLPHHLFCTGSRNYMYTGSIKVTKLHQWSNPFFVVVQYAVVSMCWYD